MVRIHLSLGHKAGPVAQAVKADAIFGWFLVDNNTL